MVTAFVLIHVEGKSAHDLAEELAKLKGVAEVHLVAGEYDMVAVLRVETNQCLSELITRQIIHKPGVQRTKTLFALESFSQL
ncbi:MAG: Lrp/AsnC ligand binding domain-containing protein [Lentisphaeria bacterium]|nr:Lrp/AsnC ligand binding domain-containing protein [Lentisphaeria bacterium]